MKARDLAKALRKLASVLDMQSGNAQPMEWEVMPGAVLVVGTANAIRCKRYRQKQAAATAVSEHVKTMSVRHEPDTPKHVASMSEPMSESVSPGMSAPSLSDLRSSPDPENSSSLSASSGSESKRARRTKRARPKPAKWSRLPADFVPDETHKHIAIEEGVDLGRELAKCQDHEFNPPRSDAAATFRQWLRRAGEHQRDRANQRPPGLVEHQRTRGGDSLAERFLAQARLTGGR